jgi:hypothetical protein
MVDFLSTLPFETLAFHDNASSTKIEVDHTKRYNAEADNTYHSGWRCRCGLEDSSSSHRACQALDSESGTTPIIKPRHLHFNGDLPVKVLGRALRYRCKVSRRPILPELTKFSIG